MTRYKESGVVFDEGRHTYALDGRELSGVTSLIHEVLRLGVYPEATQYVREVQIPKAGHYGKCVHKAIQTWNELGIEAAQFPAVEHRTQHYGVITFDPVDVKEDLAYYVRNVVPKKRKYVTSEFLVAYGSFASAVDEVWEMENADIYLVDHKTNNLDYYPGGAEALKEYLSWQLSCYAFMFERQTGLKVKGLVGNWQRHGTGEMWRIERKPDDKVECLLNTEVKPNPWYDPLVGGVRFFYSNPEMQVFPDIPDAPAVVTDNALAVPEEVTKAIADLLRAEKRAKEMKERLRALMEENGVTKWECGEFTATIGKESVSKTFDPTAFKKADPETYAKYVKEVSKKGSFIIKAK